MYYWTYCDNRQRQAKFRFSIPDYAITVGNISASNRG